MNVKSQDSICWESTKNFISLGDFQQVVYYRKTLCLEEKLISELRSCTEFLENSIQNKKLIYGYNTGFGALGNFIASEEEIGVLQKKLIYHLCTGSGEEFSEIEKRAILFSRLVSLSKGFSAIRVETFQALVHFLNQNILPSIPERGTVGASGDLTPLAHLTLSYLGESSLFYENKKFLKKELFEKLQIPSLDLQKRDGLAIVNGTSVMTGLAILNGMQLDLAIRVSLIHSLFFAEWGRVSKEIYHPAWGNLKAHVGMQKILVVLNQLLESSPIQKIPPISDSTFSKEELPQPVYSIRAIPQVLGAILDVLLFHMNVCQIELNSVNDNPVLIPEENLILHGANFYGQHIAFSSDSLKNAITKLAILSERRIARMTDKTSNQGLPPFLTGGKSGLNSGFMGAQVSASALLAEIRGLGTPMSIQSIPTNANNQDIVPMGTIAARMSGLAMNLVWEILAIESACISQVISLKNESSFSTCLIEYAKWVQRICPPLEEDRPLSLELKELALQLSRSEEQISRLIPSLSYS
jgi:tyrosine ammonia-lyase